MTTPSSRIETLPPELILEIVSYVQVEDYLCLKMTCQTMRQHMSAKPSDLIPSFQTDPWKRHRLQDFRYRLLSTQMRIEMELSAKAPDMHMHHLVCIHCGKIKSLRHFLDSDRKSLHSKIVDGDTDRRCCIQCLPTFRIFNHWPAPPALFYNGIEQFLCQVCDQLKRKSCLYNGNREYLCISHGSYLAPPCVHVCKCCYRKVYQEHGGKFRQRAINLTKPMTPARYRARAWTRGE